MARTHSHEQPNSPEDDAALAREILADGDLPHAMFHLAGALASNPTNPAWLELFDEIASKSPDPPSLIPDDGKGFWHGLAACRARLLYRAGRRHDALCLISQVIPAFPAQGYHAWAEEWVKSPGQLLDARPAFTLFGGLGKRYADDVLAMAEERAELEKLFPLVDALCEKLPSEAFLQGFRGTLRKKAGRLDEGVEITGRAYQVSPCWQTAVLAAGALKAKGDLAAARAFFLKALTYEPADFTAHLDLGDMALDAGDLEEALNRYQIVLKKEKEHPWAEPSAAYVRWFRDGDDASLRNLRRLASQSGPALARASVLMAHVRSQRAFERLFPGEATLDTLTQIAESYKKQGKPIPRGMELKITVTACESPSAFLAVRRTLPDCKLAVAVTRVQTPDPRLPSGAVDFVLWKYEGTDPVPAVPASAGPVRSGLVRIAASKYGLDEWKKYARSLVAETGPADPLPEVLSALVDPPVRPGGSPLEEWVWMLRVHLAGALVLASLDDGWKDSRRRRALLSLARGPLDWSVTTAIVALGEVALECPESREEISAEFHRMLRRVPEPGHTCWLLALAETALEVPGLSADDALQYLEIKKQFRGADSVMRNARPGPRLAPPKAGCLGLVLAILAGGFAS